MGVVGWGLESVASWLCSFIWLIRLIKFLYSVDQIVYQFVVPDLYIFLDEAHDVGMLQ